MGRLFGTGFLTCVLVSGLTAGAASAPPPPKLVSVAEQYLFSAANAERMQRGLPPLKWDDTLHRAAERHAGEMASRESISHQYPGEADLANRGRDAGARFTVISENVAEAWSAPEIHDAWMHSPDHRANLLDPRVDAIGISVERRGDQLYAVEDFDRSLQSVPFENQETTIADLLQTQTRLRMMPDVEDARRTCEMSTGYAGTVKPWFVMRFTTASLDKLPNALRAKLATGKYHWASVGACNARNTGPFTAYSIAVLLYP